MFANKTFGAYTSSTVNNSIFQQVTLNAVNPTIGILQTYTFERPFSTVPVASITVQSSDDNRYTCTIVSISNTGLTYVLFPVYVAYQKYKYYRIVFQKNYAVANSEAPTTRIAIGRLKLYSSHLRQIPASNFTLSSNQSSIAGSDVQNLVNPTTDVLLSWNADIPVSGQLQLNIAFATSTSISSYEFVSQTYPNNMSSLFSHQPSTWEILGSNDNVNFTLIQFIERFSTVANCSEAISSFPLPAPTLFATVSIHITATNPV